MAQILYAFNIILYVIDQFTCTCVICNYRTMSMNILLSHHCLQSDSPPSPHSPLPPPSPSPPSPTIPHPEQDTDELINKLLKRSIRNLKKSGEKVENHTRKITQKIRT